MANSISLILASFVSSDPKSQAADQPIKIVVKIPEKVIDLELERKPWGLACTDGELSRRLCGFDGCSAETIGNRSRTPHWAFVRLVVGQDGSASAAGLFQSYWQWYQRMDCPIRRSSIPDILTLSGFGKLTTGTNSEFCFGYLTIIDTACPSLSDRVGKVPDSAQRSAASFGLSSLASSSTD